MRTLDWIRSTKGKPQVVVNGFLFRIKNNVNNGRVYWNCITQECRATAITNKMGLIQENGHHNHPVDEHHIPKKQFFENCKDAIRLEPLKPIPAIISKQKALLIADSKEQKTGIAFLPGYNSLKSTLSREKRKNFPPQATLRAALVIDGQWCRTADGRSFIG
jgi:hypothetical protein